MKSKALFWALRIIPAVILLQTLYFKFSGAKVSIDIFTKMGMEPWGRYGTGVFELIAGILLLIPKRSVLGAFLAAGVISGAILSHLFILGIEVDGDHGQVFYMAIAVFICSAIILLQNKKDIPVVGKLLS
jgi:uncharacterized membrane protein YphA (DoxX/SURF4 family)